jgi:phytanoyl-CoA hydroxylase
MTLSLQWAKSGVVHLEGFLDVSACDRLRAVAAEIISHAYRQGEPAIVFGGPNANHDENPLFLDSGSVARVFHEYVADANQSSWDVYRSSVARIGHGLHVVVPEVARLLHDPRLRETLVGDIGYQSPAVIESLFLFKSAFAGQLHVHLDHTFLWTDPPSVALLWFALEDADVENGCLYIDPRGAVASAPLRMRREGDRAIVVGPPSAEMPSFDQLEPHEALKGDLVMLDGRVPHASAPGAPDGRSRDVLALHVVDLAAYVPPDLYLGNANLALL